jgi:hypothetical protein
MGSSSWSLDGIELTNSSLSKCNSSWLLGGHNIFTGNKPLTRIFDLSRFPHMMINIDFDIFFIDFWDGESLLIMVDEKVVKTITPNVRTNHYTNICGNYTYDSIESFSHEFEHIRPSLNLTLTTELNGVTQRPARSWGIRDFKMNLRVQCQSNSVRINNTYCECKMGYFRSQKKNLEKLGYHGNFNFECKVCPYPSKLCLASDHALECLAGFSLRDGVCLLPNGNQKVINLDLF